MIKYTVKVYPRGSKFLYQEGNRHREDGPAIEYANGSKLWYFEGKLHREDGPAIEYDDGYKAWFLKGKEYTEEEHLKKTKGNTCEGKVIEVDGVKYKLMKE